MRITTGFNGGSIDVISVSSHAAELQLKGDPSRRKSLSSKSSISMQWFFFRCHSLPLEELVTLRITNANDATFADSWDNFKVCASYDKRRWFQIDTRYDGQDLCWDHAADFSTCYYALREPYSVDQYLDFVSEIQVLRGDLVDLECIGEISDSAYPVEVLHIVNEQITPERAENMYDTPEVYKKLDGGDNGPSLSTTSQKAKKIPPSVPTRKSGSKPVPPPRKRNAGSFDLTPRVVTMNAQSDYVLLRDAIVEDEAPPMLPPRKSNPEPVRDSSLGQLRRSLTPAPPRSTKNSQMESLRREVLRETQLRSGTLNMVEAMHSRGTSSESLKAHGGKRSFQKKLAKLESELGAYNAKIDALHLQLRALCTDWWFGHSLVDFAHATERALPLVVESCVNALKVTGLTEEGLFRVPGDVAEVDEFKAAFERAEDPLSDLEQEEMMRKIHSVGSLLKLYFRELEDPLLTHQHYDKWIALGSTMGVDDCDATKIKSCQDLINKLPLSHQDVLRFFIPFLSQVAQQAEVNKMNPKNLAVVFGPTILQPPNDGDASLDAMTNMLRDSQPQIALTSFLIRNHGKILFDDSKVVKSLPKSIEANPVKESPNKAPVSSGPPALLPKIVKAKTWRESQYLDLDLSRDEAERVIKSVGVDGAFLMRASTGSASALSYTITFMAENTIHNHRLKLDEGKVVVNNKMSFNNISHLVANFQIYPLFGEQKLKYPCSRHSAVVITRAMESGSSKSEAIESLADVWEEDPYDRTSPQYTQNSQEVIESNEPSRKLRIWIIGRQQAAASHASFWVEGLVRKLLDRDDAVSESLLEKAEFHIAPSLNLDGCDKGYFRENTSGSDLTSAWFSETSTTIAAVNCIREAMTLRPPDVWIDVQSLECSEGCRSLSSWLRGASTSNYQQYMHEEMSQALANLNPDFLGSDSNLMSDEPLGGCAYAAKTFGCMAMSIALPLNAVNGKWLNSKRYKRLGSSTLDALNNIIDRIELCSAPTAAAQKEDKQSKIRRRISKKYSISLA